ncbi:MAG: flagellar protein FliT [Herminiimonas sp.]|nr:flagellar protein FliT [Herminiimonas sp.]
MNSHEVIALYETVATITDQMLAAARQGDWEKVTLLEAKCASHVAILKRDEPPAPLTGEIRVRKVQIIKQILAHDREIRTIAEPWMTKLSQLINSTSAERKLSQAYGN